MVCSATIHTNADVIGITAHGDAAFACCPEIDARRGAREVIRDFKWAAGHIRIESEKRVMGSTHE